MNEKQNYADRIAKWAVLADDTGVPMPQRVVAVAVIRTQSGISEDFVLVRDHNSPNDVVLDDGVSVDLAEGNVFYTIRRCDVPPQGCCERRQSWRCSSTTGQRLLHGLSRPERRSTTCSAFHATSHCSVAMKARTTKPSALSNLLTLWMARCSLRGSVKEA